MKELNGTVKELKEKIKLMKEYETWKYNMIKEIETYKHDRSLERIRIEMAERKKLENLKFRLKEEYFNMSRGKR